MRFYSMQPSELFNLDNETALMLFNQIDQIEAIESLQAISVVSYPELKEQNRKKLFDSLKSKANPVKKEERALTTADIANFLKGKN